MVRTEPACHGPIKQIVKHSVSHLVPDPAFRTEPSFERLQKHKQSVLCQHVHYWPESYAPLEHGPRESSVHIQFDFLFFCIIPDAENYRTDAKQNEFNKMSFNYRNSRFIYIQFNWTAVLSACVTSLMEWIHFFFILMCCFRCLSV